MNIPFSRKITNQNILPTSCLNIFRQFFFLEMPSCWRNSIHFHKQSLLSKIKLLKNREIEICRELFIKL